MYIFINPKQAKPNEPRVTWEMAQKEINKQAEILGNIKSHIHEYYSSNAKLVSEISEIISCSFTVSSQKTPVSKVESESSCMLLKQHIEIEKLKEDLQQAQDEKQEFLKSIKKAPIKYINKYI